MCTLQKIYKPSIYNNMCLLNFSEAGRMSFTNVLTIYFRSHTLHSTI